MDTATYLDRLAEQGTLLAGAAGRTDPGTPVPSCPDWVLRDLVRHTGGVHQWATGIVTTPRTERWDADLEEVVGTWPPDAELVDWYRASHARLVAALRDADPDLRCFTFLAAPSPRVMWARRQAHETAIHRVDAELAAGIPVSPVDVAFAADGIDELLAGFITRGARRLYADPPRLLRVHATDTGDVWDVRFRTGPVVTVHNGPDEHADATIAGPAPDLYLALWSRRDAGDLARSGDPGTLAHFFDRVHVNW